MASWFGNVFGQKNEAGGSPIAPAMPSISEQALPPAIDAMPTASAARSVEAQVERPVIDHKALALANLGSHHWAMTPRGVGIVTACDGTSITVNLCRPNGLNLMTLSEDGNHAVVDKYVGPLDTVRRAYIEEIPVRNREFDDEYAGNNADVIKTFKAAHPGIETYEQFMRMHGYIPGSEATK